MFVIIWHLHHHISKLNAKTLASLLTLILTTMDILFTSHKRRIKTTFWFWIQKLRIPYPDWPHHRKRPYCCPSFARCPSNPSRIWFGHKVADPWWSDQRAPAGDRQGSLSQKRDPNWPPRFQIITMYQILDKWKRQIQAQQHALNFQMLLTTPSKNPKV